jgi:hypothetical protein
LRLYCEHDSGWHTTQRGNYRFRPDQEWACRLRDKWNSLVAISKRVVPLAKMAGGDSIATPIEKIGGVVGERLPGRAPVLAGLASGLGRIEEPQLADPGTRKLLRELIDLLDTGRKVNERNGGQDRCIVEDGRLLWHCPDHLRPYQGQ